MIVYGDAAVAVEARTRAPVRRERFPEKQFYLDEFHEKTLLFAFAPGAADTAHLEGFVSTLEDLVREDARVIVLVADEGFADRLGAQVLHRSLGKPALAQDQPDGPGLDWLVRLWAALRAEPVVILRSPEPSWSRSLRYVTRLATRLRVYKLVLVDPAGGIGRDRILSFLDDKMLESLLMEGEAESLGIGERRPLIEAIREVLVGDVPSVNLCTMEGLARELFTYEGSGSLFTLEDYCSVERLQLDDFPEVERLLERGQREGFLKRRNRREIAQILFTGYGAKIGSGHLAGVGSLLSEPYARDRAGEIVALYTITRFQGEGVGARLLDRILADARRASLEYVFACTNQERAMTFFARHDFGRVGQDDVPATKWKRYDVGRIENVAVFRRNLAG